MLKKAVLGLVGDLLVVVMKGILEGLAIIAGVLLGLHLLGRL